MSIFIFGNVPSLKNSKQIVPITDAKTGLQRQIIVESKNSKQYRKQAEQQFELYRRQIEKMLEGKKKPYKIGFYFVRDSKRHFDYINAAQLPLDIMVNLGILEDDDNHNVIPVFEGYEVDADNAGLKLTVY